ncbi:MAG: NAD-dependent epimerase/dehydratase family protein [Janthinobacterium lividum]
MNRQKVLVTGGNGFMARNLCPILQQAGYEVITTTRTPYASQCHNVVTGDLEKFQDWDSLFLNVDAVIHLAARVHIMNDTAQDPLAEFRRANCEATRCLAETAQNHGVKHFIYLSSIHVNGNHSSSYGFTEQDQPQPQTPYARSKFEAENMLMQLCGKMTLTRIRIPLVYGKGVKGNFQSLIKLCKLPVPLPFKGCVNNQRSFLFVENFCDFIKKCLQSTDTSGLYFVADDQRLSTADLISQIRTSLDQKPLLFTVPFLETLLPRSFAEKLTENMVVINTKAKTSFNWQPPYTTQEGLQKMLKDA